MTEQGTPPGDRRLRIGIALRSNSAWMGGRNYVLSCIDALLALPEDERPEIHLLWTSPSARRDAEPFLDKVQGTAHLSLASRLNLDFVYPVKEISEAPSAVPWGGWIVDWQQRYLPDLFDRAEHLMRELRYQAMAESAPVVAHSSTQACEDTARWVPGAQAVLGVLNFRATLESDVLVGDMDETRRRYNLPPRFAVVSNQWYRHKNHPVVIEALRLLMARGVTIPCVVTGRAEDHRWPDYGPSLQRRIAVLGLSNTVYLVGLVPRVDQVQLIRGATIVIQPSHFEGWSTIVEEARSLGKTIVLSDIPVHREQSPPHGHFFDPDDPVSLADTLERVWNAPVEPRHVREAEASQEHARLQTDAGRALVRLARIGVKRYDPSRSDPARVLLRMAHDAVHLGPDGERTRDFVVQALHIWFGRHPWRFPGFAADLLQTDASTRAWIESAVLPGMARSGLRAYHLAWADKTSVRIGWYPALIDVVKDLSALSASATHHGAPLGAPCPDANGHAAHKNGEEAVAEAVPTG